MSVSTVQKSGISAAVLQSGNLGSFQVKTSGAAVEYQDRKCGNEELSSARGYIVRDGKTLSFTCSLLHESGWIQ